MRAWTCVGLALLLLAGTAPGRCAEDGPATVDAAVKALSEAGLPAADLERLRQRSDDAGIADTDQLRLMKAMISEESIPLGLLLNKSFEAISKRVPAARAVRSIEMLKARLIQAKKVLTGSLGHEPDDDLVTRAAVSRDLGLGEAHLVKLALTASAWGDEGDARLKTLLELCDEFISRKAPSARVAAIAMRVAKADYGAHQIGNIAAAVRRDFADFPKIAPTSVLEAVENRVARGFSFSAPPAGVPGVGAGGSHGGGGGGNAHPPHPPHPHGGPPGQNKR